MTFFTQTCSYPPAGIDPCNFIRSNCNGFIEGSINYPEIYFCKLSQPFEYLFIWALLSLLVVFFIFIGISASEFFCPNLAAIAHSLDLSESISGVTLLALGNGSLDLFSTFSAMRSSAGALAIGELVGSAAFVTTLTVGTVAYLSPFQLQPYLLIRDGGFLWGALALNLYVLWDNQITFFESLLLISYYFLYVGVVAYLDYSQTCAMTADLVAPLLISSAGTNETVNIIEQDYVSDFAGRMHKSIQVRRRKFGFLDTMAFYEQFHADLQMDGELLTPLSPETFHLSKVSLLSLLFPKLKISPCSPKIEKCFWYLISPVYAVLRASIPVAAFPHSALSIFNTELRYLPLNAIQAFFGALITSIAIFDILGVQWSFRRFSWPLFFAIFSMFAYIYCAKSRYFAKNDSLICWFGFAVSMSWVYLIANEVVAILRFLGFLYQITDSVLGLTLFSIGNSLGDFVSNITIAKMGFPTMALTACFATPMLNLILGVGFSTACLEIYSGSLVELVLDKCIFSVEAGLLVVIFFYLVVLPYKQFFLDKYFGIFLIFLYFAILSYAFTM